jgi:predicted lactoylglutathione lyase
MKLGAFSISLAVKDLQASKAFYEKLGFSVFAGKEERNYLIMKNEGTLIGLFQGMFENNILTFNPGWDQSANILDKFDDVRTIKENLTQAGVEPLQENILSDSGPGSMMLMDPDGNAILIDQHAE